MSLPASPLFGLLDGADPDRRAAHAAALADGLPNKKQEAWRATPLGQLDKAEFTPARGVYDVHEDQGVAVTRVPANGATTISALGRLATDETFTALNATLMDEVLHVRVPTGAQASLSLESFAAPGSASFPRLLLEVEERASLTLVERHRGESGEASLSAPVAELYVGAGARLDHVRVLAAPSHHVAELDVNVAKDGRYRLHLATLGGALTRTDLRVTLAEPGAECELYGATHANDAQVADVHVLLRHAAAHCTSRQRFHTVLDGEARGVVDGIVAVDHGAQKTEAHQNLATLLLSERCRVDAKPHMEIEADDVVASHGNTVGALEDEALFYLRSRGIGEAAARTLLTWAFVKRVLDGVPEAARAEVERAFLDRFGGDDLSLEEL